MKRAGKWTEGSSVDTAGGAWTVGSLGREIAGRQLGDELLERAPDLFAFTDVVLVRSEAYRFAVSAPDGASWPPPEMPRLVSRGCRRQRRLVHLGKAPQTTVNATENPILRAQNGVDRTDCSTPERRQCARRSRRGPITQRNEDRPTSTLPADYARPTAIVIADACVLRSSGSARVTVTP